MPVAAPDLPMFVVSDISKLRVYVNVPQNYVPSIKIGAKAVISMPEYPDRTFLATVEASSQSVDVGSGTTRMQLALDNAKGELMPGGYANVRMSLQRDTLPLHIPASALIFNKSGMRVATVGPDDKVLFKTVTIARDLGKDIELASGLSPDDRIIVAPPDGIADGDQVRVAGATRAGRNPRRRRSSRAARGRGGACPRLRAVRTELEPRASTSLPHRCGRLTCRWRGTSPAMTRESSIPPATPARHPPPWRYRPAIPPACGPYSTDAPASRCHCAGTRASARASAAVRSITTPCSTSPPRP